MSFALASLAVAANLFALASLTVIIYTINNTAAAAIVYAKGEGKVKGKVKDKDKDKDKYNNTISKFILLGCF
jgi:hypothetical protein